MKAPFKYIVFIAFSMTFLFSTAQLNELDFRMAMNYYNNGDFEKAAMYFDKIYSKSNLNEIYEPYRRTLIELDRFKEAEKICKLQVKNYPEKYNYLVDYGKLMESWDAFNVYKGQRDGGAEVQDSMKPYDFHDSISIPMMPFPFP